MKKKMAFFQSSQARGADSPTSHIFDDDNSSIIGILL